MIGNCIRMMCRSPKSRAGCHFGAAVGLRSLLEGFAPEIPDHALDMHPQGHRRLRFVTTVETQDGTDPEAWQKAADHFSFAYQPSVLKEPVLSGLRRTIRLGVPRNT